MNTDHRQQQITLPGLSFKDREIAYIKVMGHMHKSERTDEGSDNRKPATVMKVLNLQDNLEYRLICPALMVSSFSDEDEEYVGNCYEVIVSAKPVPGKQYKNVQVYKIDPNMNYAAYPNHIEQDDEASGDKKEKA